MRRMWLPLVIVVLGLVTGCTRSLHPLYTEKELIFDSSLLGCWMNDEQTERWQVTKGENQQYDILFTDENGATGTFVAHLLKLDDKLFLDLFPAEVDAGTVNTFHYFHMVPVHTFAHVRQTAPDLILLLPNPEWLEKLLEEKPEAIRHDVSGGGFLLTATTSELQAFWLEHLGTEDAYRETVVLTRCTAGGR